MYEVTAESLLKLVFPSHNNSLSRICFMACLIKKTTNCKCYVSKFTTMLGMPTESLVDLVQLCGGQKYDDIEQLGHAKRSRSLAVERSRSLAVACTDMEEEDKVQQREINQQCRGNLSIRNM